MLRNKIRWLQKIGRQMVRVGRRSTSLARMIQRVAARKIYADVRAELDQLARLQVVLGALDIGDEAIRGGKYARGKPWDHLKKIEEDLGKGINPLFFSGMNLGLYDIPRAVAAKALRERGISEDMADDLMQIMMSGVGKTQDRKMSFVEIGRRYKDRILNGTFKPGVAAAIAAKHASNAISTYIKTYFKKLGLPPMPGGPAQLFRSEKTQYWVPKGVEKQQTSERFEEKWKEREIPTEAVKPRKDRFDVFVDLFKNLHDDPLGKILNNYIRAFLIGRKHEEQTKQEARLKDLERKKKQYEGDPKFKGKLVEIQQQLESAENKVTDAEVAAYWLLQLADKGSAPSWVELGKRYGLTEVGVRNKIKRILERLYHELQRDPNARIPGTKQSILDAIEWRAERQRLNRLAIKKSFK